MKLTNARKQALRQALHDGGRITKGGPDATDPPVDWRVIDALEANLLIEFNKRYGAEDIEFILTDEGRRVAQGLFVHT